MLHRMEEWTREHPAQARAALWVGAALLSLTVVAPVTEGVVIGVEYPAISPENVSVSVPVGAAIVREVLNQQLQWAYRVSSEIRGGPELNESSTP